MLTDHDIIFLLGQVEQLSSRYADLHLKLRRGVAYIVGDLKFNAVRGEEMIADSYLVEIQFPADYPLRPPTVKEIEGRIPRITDYHVSPDQTLCLGPPLEVLRQFKRDPTILGFLENLVIPELFWHSYNKIHPQTPLLAYSHGDDGIAEYRKKTDLQAVYFELFETNKLSTVLRLLEIILRNTYRTNLLCPCESGKMIDNCHGKLLHSVASMPYLKATHLAQDYWHLKDKYGTAKKRH